MYTSILNHLRYTLYNFNIIYEFNIILWCIIGNNNRLNYTYIIILYVFSIFKLFTFKYYNINIICKSIVCFFIFFFLIRTDHSSITMIILSFDDGAFDRVVVLFSRQRIRNIRTSNNSATFCRCHRVFLVRPNNTYYIIIVYYII